jgi:alpha-mannosidase
VNDGTMALTLIKSGVEPNPTTDQEEHYFTYAIYPHAENWRNSNTVQEAYKLNQPAFAVNGGMPGEQFSFAGVDKKNVMIETIKQAEDGNGIILRMYECENAAVKAFVTLGKASQIVSVEECNLIEESIAKVDFNQSGFPIQIKPYEIKTYKVVFK